VPLSGCGAYLECFEGLIEEIRFLRDSNSTTGSPAVCSTKWAPKRRCLRDDRVLLLDGQNGNGSCH